MIEISLYGKTDRIVEVARHPEFLDYPGRDSRASTTAARVEIADENFLAPIVAALDGKTTIETFELLNRARMDIVRAVAASTPACGLCGRPRALGPAGGSCGGHRDAIRLLDFLELGRPYPQARWRVAGAPSFARAVRFVSRATIARLPSTSLTADPLARGVRFIGEAARMDEIDVDDELERLLQLGPAYEEISGAALLQREIRIAPTGGGSKNKGRKKSAKGGVTFADGSTGWIPPTKTTKTKTAVVSTRVSEEAKDAIDHDPKSKQRMMEAVGRALLSGRTYADILVALEPPAY